VLIITDISTIPQYTTLKFYLFIFCTIVYVNNAVVNKQGVNFEMNFLLRLCCLVIALLKPECPCSLADVSFVIY